MLKTRNIFIDTEVFIKNNFFTSKNLPRLAEFGRLKTVNLYLTEVTKNEVSDNIKQQLADAQQEINQFKKALSNKSKIVKHFQAFQAYLELPNLNIELLSSELLEILEEFIDNGNVQFIPLTHADIGKVMDQYFGQLFPFSGKKKHEFPDAVVLSSLENWCASNQTEIYIISGDPDFKNQTSDKIIQIDSVKVMLDIIIKQYQNDEIDWIEAVYEYREHDIEDAIRQKFMSKIVDEIGFDVEIYDLRVDEIYLHESSLVEDTKSAEFLFQLDYDITFSANIIYDDYSFSTYDREDDRYYFVENRKKPISLTCTLSAEVGIEAYFEDGDDPATASAYISCNYTSIPDSYDITENIDNDY